MKPELTCTLALIAWGSLLLFGKVYAMTHNLACAWNDACSPPQTAFLSFHSPQSDTLMFDRGRQIELRCQAGLRSVGLKWKLHRNTINTPFREGVADALPGNRFAIRLDTAGLHPGFYDLKVELDTGMTTANTDRLAERPVAGVCGFGWQVDRMAIADSRPKDFAAFWTAAKAELAAIPVDAREGPMTSYGPEEINAYNVSNACLPPDYDPDNHRAERVESCKVDIAGPVGGRVYGWLARPAGEGRFPAMLILPGAGNKARPRPLEHARHGFVALDIQVHGQDVDLVKYPALPGDVAPDSSDPRTGYYRHVHLRCVQAINYLASRPDVDANRIVLVGGSQGGRLGIVVAGLDPRVKAVVASIAHYGNHPYRAWASRCNARKRTHGTPDPVFGADGMGLAGAPSVGDEPASRRDAHYDPMNFAPDVRCPVLMTSGLVDPVSPPSAVFAVFNRLGTRQKEMVTLDGLGHDWSAAFDRQAWRWLDRVLARDSPVNGPSATASGPMSIP